jgi:very-short-patch-repair endonuclease
MVCDVVNAQERFSNFISHKRASNNDDEIMIELDKLAHRWRQSKDAAHTNFIELRRNLGLRKWL